LPAITSIILLIKNSFVSSTELHKSLSNPVYSFSLISVSFVCFSVGKSVRFQIFSRFHVTKWNHVISYQIRVHDFR
jgi:hypothetical protein